jgi:hypothetical protein
MTNSLNFPQCLNFSILQSRLYFTVSGLLPQTLKRTLSMKKTLLVAAVVAAFAATAVATCSAQKPDADQKTDPHAAEFNAFYADFRKAVAANDKEKIADMIAFPVADWSVETKGDVQTISIKDRADFLKRYNVLFTSFMRVHAARGKLLKLEPLNGAFRYSLIWKDANVECSFEFGYAEGTGYRVTAYGIGPL